MTTRSLRIMVAMLDVLFAVAASAHAESAWTLWQQATVFTERGWIPTGWSLHWKATERTPVGLSEFRTLADCQLAQTQAMIRASDPATDMGAVETSGTPVARTVSRFACVPFGWRPTRIEPGGLWK